MCVNCIQGELGIAVMLYSDVLIVEGYSSPCDLRPPV